MSGTVSDIPAMCAHGVEEDGLWGLAVDLLLRRLRSHGTLHDLPEGVPAKLSPSVSLFTRREVIAVETYCVDELSPWMKSNAPGPSVVPPANEKPIAGGHVRAFVPFWSVNSRNDLQVDGCQLVLSLDLREESPLTYSHMYARTSPYR